MKKRFIFFLLAVLTLLNCARFRPIRVPGLPEKAVPEIAQELRGVWVARFNWADEDPEVMRLRIIEIFERISRGNFNTVFFQVRGQAETLYPSPIEPWSKLTGFKDPGFDPVALAVEEAHKHGLKFHAYMNLLPMWNEENPPEPVNHIYHTHGPQSGDKNCWVCYGPDGKPMKLNEYYYMNPALPEVKSYLKKVFRHFVTTYDVDGIHFDRIRYPGTDYINDPYSKKKFKADSLKTAVSRTDWARRKLTGLVEDVVTEILIVKPYLQISAATWGLYKTKDVKGYEHFNSGYANYYQDAIDWLDKGIMDFIVPMIYWDMPEPKPNFHELWDDFKKRTANHHHIFPGMRVRKEWITNGETFRQVKYLRQNSGRGHVMWSYSAITNDMELELVRKFIYPKKVVSSVDLRRIYSKNVVSIKFTRADSTVLSGEDVEIEQYFRQKTADSEGRIGIILPEIPEQFEINTLDSNIPIPTRDWKQPFKYTVKSDGSYYRESPWVEFRRMPSALTNQSGYDFLCKTYYPAKTYINGDSVKIYRTGIFFKNITFKEGANRVKAEIITPDSLKAIYEREFYYEKEDRTRKSFPLWIDEESIEPSVGHVLLDDDVVRISFMGSKGQNAYAEVKPGKTKIALSRDDFYDYSQYSCDIYLKSLKKHDDLKITIFLEPSGKEKGIKKLKHTIKPVIRVQNRADFPLVKVKNAGSIVTYNLGQIRLGGPIIGEYDPGVIFKVNGTIGNKYRVYLNNDETGFINIANVEILPEKTSNPGYYIRSMMVGPGMNEDIVSIPYREPVPYAVFPEPDLNRIVISLYGVKTSSTWITHLKGLETIKKVTWEQPKSETYRVIVNLKSSKIWGYELKPEGRSLKLRIKHPPVLFMNKDSINIRGLKVAIEAGHGGSSRGAVGLSGLFEKEVNLDVSKELEKILLDNEVEVIQIRETDMDMSITEKHNKADKSGADLVVSIHANAGGGGYLRVSGTSTYYNNPFWAEFAEKVYERLLQIDLKEFGVVGSFNYRVIRLSSKPTILVEQAFMSHAEDEEKLASKIFRRRIARKIFQGIVDYLEYLTE